MPRPLAVGVEMTHRPGETARGCGINCRRGKAARCRHSCWSLGATSRSSDASVLPGKTSGSLVPIAGLRFIASRDSIPGDPKRTGPEHDADGVTGPGQAIPSCGNADVLTLSHGAPR